MIHDAKHSNGG